MNTPEIEAEIVCAEARSNAFFNGIRIADLPDHREAMFQNFSMERRSSMPDDLRRKLRRARFDSRAGDMAQRARNKERAQLVLQSDNPEVGMTP